MVELNLEHVLILLIAAFVVYHLVGRCRCNGFRVSGADINYCVALPGTEECYNNCKALGYNCQSCWHGCAFSDSLSQEQRKGSLNKNFKKVNKCIDKTSHDPTDACNFYETFNNFAIYCKPKYGGWIPLEYPCEPKGKDDDRAVSYIGPKLIPSINV